MASMTSKQALSYERVNYGGSKVEDWHLTGNWRGGLGELKVVGNSSRLQKQLVFQLTSEAAGIPDDLNPPALPNHNLYNLI
jgi:hypothetical protein